MMTEQNDAHEPADLDEQTETTNDDVDDETEQSSGDDGPNAEAARYRHRAKAAEAERDRLAEQVETLQRREVDRLAEAEQVRPTALWASGANLDDLLGDDGAVDVDKVTAAVQHARGELGLAPPKPGNYVPREGNVPDTTSSGLSMVDIAQGRHE